MQIWDTAAGVIVVVWTLPDARLPSALDLFERLPFVDVLVGAVQSDFGIDGPGLSTTQRRGPKPGTWRNFGMRWADLSPDSPDLPPIGPTGCASLHCCASGGLAPPRSSTR